MDMLTKKVAWLKDQAGLIASVKRKKNTHETFKDIRSYSCCPVLPALPLRRGLPLQALEYFKQQFSRLAGSEQQASLPNIAECPLNTSIGFLTLPYYCALLSVHGKCLNN